MSGFKSNQHIDFRQSVGAACTSYIATTNFTGDFTGVGVAHPGKPERLENGSAILLQ